MGILASLWGNVYLNFVNHVERVGIPLICEVDSDEGTCDSPCAARGAFKRIAKVNRGIRNGFDVST